MVLSMTKRQFDQSNRVVIVGGVAGGMSAATRRRRLDAEVTITVLERSGHLSFADCGLPYFVGGKAHGGVPTTCPSTNYLPEYLTCDHVVNSRHHRFLEADAEFGEDWHQSGSEGVKVLL